MSSKALIDDFLAQPALAVAGVSRNGRKFGNMALKGLREKGYRVFAVNPHGGEIAGERCYARLADLPESVGGVLIAVPRSQCESVVREAAAAGIRRVWIQQGSESPEALRFCEENGISAVARECIFMFADPRGIHKFHRFIWGVLGKLPS